jgi:fructokinase
VAGFKVKAIDTTGAGDGFVAGLLYGLCHDPDVTLDEVRLSQVCKFANAVGALTSTQLGAIPALPSLDQVETFLNFGGDINHEDF